jgi:hypothetical protein
VEDAPEPAFLDGDLLGLGRLEPQLWLELRHRLDGGDGV